MNSKICSVVPWIVGSVIGVILIVLTIITILSTKLIVDKCFKRFDFDLTDEKRVKKAGIILDFFEDKEYREVVFKSFDDTLLTGYYVTNKPNNKKVAIVHHGYHSDHMCMTPYAKMYYDLGYDVLLIDSRNCGKSGGKFTTFGVKEARDLEKWIDQIVFMKGKNIEIILSGVSMGAVISICTTKTESAKYIKAVISDCAYTSFNEQIEHLLKSEMIKSSFLKKFAHLIVVLMNIGVKVYCKFDLKKSSPIDVLKNCDTPVLFIHGTDDELVPYWMCEKLYKTCNSKKVIVPFEGVSHAQAINQDYQKYVTVVCDFLESID